MENQPLKFIEIIKIWEKNRWLFNVVWVFSALIPFLPALNENGNIYGIESINGFEIPVFFFLTFLFNVLYLGTWMGMFFIYMVNEKIALHLTLKLRYILAFSPLIYLIIFLS